MRTPRLNRRLVLEEPNRVADGAGGFRVSWRAIAMLWGEIRPGLGRERQQDFAVISAVHYRVVVRAVPHGSSLRPKPEQRLREGARVLRIHAVGEADELGRYLTCFAYEEVAA